MSQKHPRHVTLNFLIYPCEENPRRFVAHCLEFDIVAIGDTKPKAILLLKELIDELLEAATEDGTLDKVFRPAPPEYWQKLAHARPYKPTVRVEEHHIKSPPIKSVDYALAL